MSDLHDKCPQSATQCWYTKYAVTPGPLWPKDLQIVLRTAINCAIWHISFCRHRAEISIIFIRPGMFDHNSFLNYKTQLIKLQHLGGHFFSIVDTAWIYLLRAFINWKLKQSLIPIWWIQRENCPMMIRTPVNEGVLCNIQMTADEGPKIDGNSC